MLFFFFFCSYDLQPPNKRLGGIEDGSCMCVAMCIISHAPALPWQGSIEDLLQDGKGLIVRRRRHTDQASRCMCMCSLRCSGSLDVRAQAEAPIYSHILRWGPTLDQRVACMSLASSGLSGGSLGEGETPRPLPSLASFPPFAPGSQRRQGRGRERAKGKPKRPTNTQLATIAGVSRKAPRRSNGRFSLSEWPVYYLASSLAGPPSCQHDVVRLCMWCLCVYVRSLYCVVLYRTVLLGSYSAKRALVRPASLL
jgi:hypothetical protein